CRVIVGCQNWLRCYRTQNLLLHLSPQEGQTAPRAERPCWTLLSCFDLGSTSLGSLALSVLSPQLLTTLIERNCLSIVIILATVCIVLQSRGLLCRQSSCLLFDSCRE